MIESYSFGRMVIDGRELRKDLMILPDGTVDHPWWRRAGHSLCMDDIGPIIDASPDVLVVGTGRPGLMSPEPDLCAQLEAKGITVKVVSTSKAADEFNRLSGTDKQVAACFHLTC